MIGDLTADGRLLLAENRTVPIEFLISDRARRLRIVIGKENTVKVVRPFYVSMADAEKFLRSSIPWIERMLRKTESHPHPSQKKLFPSAVSFPVTGENFNIALEWRDVCWSAVREEGSTLLVTGCVLMPEAVRGALELYLKRKAESVFEPKLQELAEKYGFHYDRMIIRLQQGRWGSCSSRGTISLNARMLFFTPEELRYVMIHELCHMREMNHSEYFWNEVAKYCPDYKRIRESIQRNKMPDFQ